MGLTDLLHDAASGAPLGASDPDLWERGRRAHRRRRTANLMIVAVTLLLVGSLLGFARQQAAPRIEPASGTPAIPERIWAPGARLATTDDRGPLGQLAALVSTVRGTEVGAPAPDAPWAGVSATTGAYRIIGLPGLAPGLDPVLSPDGTHVSYWTGAENAVTGIADYDTVSGTTRTWNLDGGLVVQPLFLGRTRNSVVAQFSRTIVPDRGPTDDVLQWFPLESRSTSATYTPVVAFGSSDSGTLLQQDGSWSLLGDVVDSVSIAGDISEARPLDNEVALSPDGSRFAFASQSYLGPMLWQRIEFGSRAQKVPKAQLNDRAIGWIDDRTIAVTRPTQPVSDAPWPRVVAVDVLSGERRPLLRLPDARTILATDLLQVPPARRPVPSEPPGALGSWSRQLAALGVVVACGGALILWRRRVRL